IINGESSEWAFFNIFSHKELKTLGAKSFTHRVLWRPIYIRKKRRICFFLNKTVIKKHPSPKAWMKKISY
ncbi:hypothetical protein, partial [Ligilactobacillus agilis]|uniref:hypothetical protein n=1 Tax=Ligilactobacillus agilis TaxID=1601 RepID=UPI003F8BB3B7